MNRMQKSNLYHIQRNFEKKTGIRLAPSGGMRAKDNKENTKYCKRMPRAALIVAIITLFITLSAFAVSIFSTRAGDSLIMTASYYGDGIVWVEITNQSDKDLKLEPEIKLYYYTTQKLVEPKGEDPYIENLMIPANSTEKVRLDLRRTYDVETLENSKNNFYYLQMTNDSFMLGQKWSCMVSFVVSDYVTPWYALSDESCLDGVLPSLKSYYLNFTPDIFARWPDAFGYLELVQSELRKVDGNLVRTCGNPIYFDQKDWLVSSNWSSFDAYNKLMGVDNTEYYTQIGVDLPCPLDNGRDSGGWVMPLFYLYQYSVSDIKTPQDYAFIRGNLLTFKEMEPYKVYDDGEYVVYEMHHLFYTDLKTYVKDMLLQRDDVYLNEQIWERIVTIYEHWGNRENLADYLYRLGEGQKRQQLTMSDVIHMSQKGDALTYDDLHPFRVGVNGYTIHESDTGATHTIDGDYELFYALRLNGTLRGWYLIHKPTGDSIDIRYEDVEAFVKAHGDPLPRCACDNSEHSAKETHGWTITMEWLLRQGNDIVAANLGNACRCRLDEEEGTDTHIEIFPIYDNDSFYIKDCWSEENHKWMLWLVHEETGDRCDLETEDAAAFVKAHGGSV